jgi:hypothetical protein
MIKLKDIISRLLEGFETSSDITSDPENNELTLSKVLRKFEEAGGEVLGQGAFGYALTHKKWNFVVKIYESDDAYTRFVRFVLQNPRNSYPKFLDKPRKFLPNFARGAGMEYMYIIRMEKLDKNEYNKYEQIYHIIQDPHRYNKNPAHLGGYENLYPNIKEFVRDLCFYLDYNKITDPHEAVSYPDIHAGNIMVRKNGELVLTDPVVGSHPGKELSKSTIKKRWAQVPGGKITRAMRKSLREDERPLKFEETQ